MVNTINVDDFNFIENYKYINEHEFAIDCPYCGKSKHNKPHCGVNLEKKIFHCFRCGESGTLAKLLKQLIKVDIANKSAYIKLYKKYYSDRIIKNKKYIEKIEKEAKNIAKKFDLKPIKDEKILKYIQKRLNVDYNKNYILKQYLFEYNNNLAIKRLNSITLYINEKKSRKVIDSQYPYDLFWLNHTSNTSENLFITEGEFDAFTLKFHYYIKGDIIALGGKFLKNLHKKVFQMRKFYYKNLFIVADNDTNDELYLKLIKKGIKFYDNLYILRPKKEYNDINDQFMNESYTLSNLIIKKYY